MNKKNIVILAMFVLVNCFSTVKASNDTASKSQTNNSTNSGLIIQIAPDRKKYQPFQPINIRITITNNTPNEVTFNKRFAVIKQISAGIKSEIHFEITKPNGEYANIEFVSETGQLSEADFVKIKPKAKYEKQLNINKWYWKELGSSGTYTFKCFYYNDKSGYLKPDEVEDVLIEMYAWTGELLSNTVSLTVEKMSKAEVGRLTSKLTNKSVYWGERSKIAELLGDIKNGWALNPLLSRLISGENEVVRNKCVEAIVKYGKSASKRLIKLLKSSDPMARVLAAKTLCLIGNRKGFGLVRREMDNKDWQVVMEAMLTLQCFDKDIAIKDILKHDLINDKEEVISFTATDILKKLGIKTVFNEKSDKWEAVK